MPAIDEDGSDGAEMPEPLRPYLFNRVDLEWDGGKEARGPCPFCGAPKFSVNADTGVSGCWSCRIGPADKSGMNELSFLRTLWEQSAREPDDCAEFAAERGLADPLTLDRWGVCRSLIDGCWVVPGWDAAGKLRQLYRYEGYPKRLLKGTPLRGAGAPERHRHGMLWAGPPDEDVVYVAEGAWDGMALWEALAAAKRGGSVLAVPGAGIFDAEWLPLLRGKTVCLMYDNDHPAEKPAGSGRMVQPGWDGMRRAAGMLAGIAVEVKVLLWGEAGFDPARPSGYDVRDFLAGA